ncbi:hypothetical protein LWI28_028864 [Acer negundo]|uniref:Uncharacterized protein n=1 Tax=Acer negundo TaxID=4023 RepID=A0AAD5JRK5_ACENE|nr:hypothetical protein LWI28_028864 [Acer negundo]KAK4856813.1 hypothetical protein QYF36_021580 [Acer negundo]
MKSLNSLPILHYINLTSHTKVKPIFSLFFSSLPRTQNSNFSLLNFLIETLNFPPKKAQSVSTLFSSRVKSPEKLQSVLRYFQNLGFSESHIRSSVRGAPQILFSNVDKTLKPKIEFFQELGLVGSDLGKFISRNSIILTYSLRKTLIPCTRILRKIFVNDNNNEELFRVLSKCGWLLSKHPDLRLLSNIAYLESCGIVGSQLSMLLKRQPRIFIMEESKLRRLGSRVSDLGFSVDSRMFVHGLQTVSGLSEETFSKKLELFRSFEFTKEEYMRMFRRAPTLPRVSEKKLKSGLDFFLNKAEFGKEMLIRAPWCLMLNIEERVIPRYEVLQILKLKRLLKKEPSFINVLNFPEEQFLEKFVGRFRDDVEELFVAYKGHLLESSSKEEEP